MKTVFISHSTKSEEECRFLFTLHTALESKLLDSKIFLDRRGLETDNKWRQSIFENIHSCKTGILLISKDALKSDFVAIEASFLTIKASCDPSFKLIPILFDNATEKQIKKRI